MVRKDIAWLDGKDAKGKFVLQIFYKSGKSAYMKNQSMETLEQYANLLSTCPDVVDTVIYNPDGEKVIYTLRYVEAA